MTFGVTYGDGVYKLLLFLHVFCAIVGFGAVFLNALYGVESKRRPGPGGLAITEANLRVSTVAEYFIYAVFVFGFLMIVVPDGGYKFSDAWVSAAMAIYVVGLALSHGILLPNVKKMRALMQELVTAGPPPAGAPAGGPPPQVAELERRGKTVGMTGATLNVLLVVILVLMVWRPT